MAEELGVKQKRAFELLAARADAEGIVSYPSVILSAQMDLAPRIIKAYLRRFSVLGLLEKIEDDHYRVIDTHTKVGRCFRTSRGGKNGLSEYMGRRIDSEDARKEYYRCHGYGRMRRFRGFQIASPRGRRSSS
ncbi:MAG: hypothetical protein WC107_02840 [Patescibacteria group bacterium]